MIEININSYLKIDKNKIYLFFSSDSEFYWWYRWCNYRTSWIYYLSPENKGNVGIDSDVALVEYIETYITGGQKVFEFGTEEDVLKYLLVWKLKK
jgi:hypothetical protein